MATFLEALYKTQDKEEIVSALVLAKMDYREIQGKIFCPFDGCTARLTRGRSRSLRAIDKYAHKKDCDYKYCPREYTSDEIPNKLKHDLLMYFVDEKNPRKNRTGGGPGGYGNGDDVDFLFYNQIMEKHDGFMLKIGGYITIERVGKKVLRLYFSKAVLINCYLEKKHTRNI